MQNLVLALFLAVVLFIAFKFLKKNKTVSTVDLDKMAGKDSDTEIKDTPTDSTKITDI
jgi:amino acid permease